MTDWTKRCVGIGLGDVTATQKDMKVRASVDRRFGLPSLRGTCVTTQRRALWPKSSTPQISPSESVAWTEEERPRSVRNSISLCRSSNRQQVHRRHPVVCSIFGPQRFCRRLHAASFDASNASSAEDAAAQIYDLPSAKVLVETSMLASVSGVCQLLLGILRLDAYMHYLLPFPLVLAAVRSGPAASRKTLVATFFLTIVLLGPPRAVTYVLLYGFIGLTLGFLWHLRCPWWLTWIACTLSYATGMICYIYVAGFLLRENLFKLVTYNVYTLVIKISSLCGIQASPSASTVNAALLGFLIIRGFFYTHILQLCYALLLNSMGYPFGSMPQFIQRWIQSSNGNNNNS